MPHPRGERRGLHEQQRRHGQHATEKEREQQARFTGRAAAPGQAQRQHPLHDEQDPENAVRAHDQLRHDLVAHFTGASRALR
jgi:hypothetical protein